MEAQVSLTPRIIDERQMDAASDAGIKQGLCACFPNDAAIFTRTRVWHGSAPAFSVLIEDAGWIIAHVGVVDRVIQAGAEELRIAGVQNVFVRPEFRGRGLVDEVMRSAMAEAMQRRMDAGLLFCLPALERVYARTSWQTLPPRTIWASRANGERYRLDEKNLLMFHSLAKEAFPAGTIDLNGDDW